MSALARSFAALACCAVWLGCASDSGGSAKGDDAARHRDLGNTTWQLVEIQSMDGKVTRPDERAKYTIAFAPDGRIAVRLDCNRGTGTWNAREGQLEIGPLAMTRAMCAPGSLSDRFARDLGLVRSYVTENDRLHLALQADGGIYVLEPAPGID